MSNLEIGLVVGFLILVWRVGIVQTELTALSEKLQEREDEREANPHATKDDLDAAVSEILDAVGDVAVGGDAPSQSSTTFPIILPGTTYKPR